MRNVRSMLTRIKNGVQEKLGDEKDLFDYPGISKTMIIDTLSECSIFVDEIEQKVETLDVIIFKRNFSEWGKSATEFLNEYAQTAGAQKRFNEFLNVLANIRKGIIETYLLVVKESLRPEAEIVEMKNYVIAMKEEKEKLENEIIQLTEALAKARDNCSEIVTIHDNVEGMDSISEENANDIKKKRDEIATYYSTIEKWSGVIEENKKEIEGQVLVLKENDVVVKRQAASISTALLDSDKLKEELSQQIKDNAEFQNEIRKTIDDANRSSMAGSFKKRKDELSGPQKTAEYFMCASLILMTLVAALIIGFEIRSPQFSYRSIMIKMPILLPLIWLAWYFTKKVGHLARISEDYAFKYAAAMAFEGYNKNVQGNEQLSNRLLELSIENMGNNPIRLYGDKSNHAGPLPEMMNNFGEATSKIVKSASNAAPAINKLIQ